MFNDGKCSQPLISFIDPPDCKTRLTAQAALAALWAARQMEMYQLIEFATSS